MQNRTSLFWKRSPFVRFLIALITGILLEWYFHPDGKFWIILFVTGIALTLVFSYTGLFTKYKYGFINGLAITSAFTAFGALLIYQKNILNDRNWFGKNLHPGSVIIATLDEPVSEKPKSLKSVAVVNYLVGKGEKRKGKIIIYFKKQENFQPDYGTQIIFSGNLEEIKNSGNPGAFDYKQYCLFQGITHQVFLDQKDYKILSRENGNRFWKFIYQSREKIINILRKNIKGEKEKGLAEALLIGYKDDLDKSLVRSYTNTGVVHIIAISGLHLGLIYLLLSGLTKPLEKKKLKWLRPLIIISGLWLFSLMAGAQPSILRSALMFTCIVTGETLARKGSVFNTMAISAFILLCINPFWLWDVGFQLSYAAVLSIIIFMKPVYDLFFIKNKLLDFIWKMNAVTLAAQVLTIPICIYYFHQFPNLFLLTNFLAVPLSSIILLGEILLCAISFIPVLASLTGKVLTSLIDIMNIYIERIESIPGSVSSNLQINFIQGLLLFCFITGTCYWLMEKSKTVLKFSLLALLGYILFQTFSLIKTGQQQKIIIYNIPNTTAIDFISGNRAFFIGDSSLMNNQLFQQYYLQPAHILNRIKKTGSLSGVKFLQFGDKHILITGEYWNAGPLETKIPVDLLVISNKSKIPVSKLNASLKINQLVIDSSVPRWKAGKLKKECDSLGIPWYDVNEKGAFIMRLR